MDSIGPDDEGVYLVTTAHGTVHEWHPKEGYYIRRPGPGPHDPSLSHFRNEQPLRWSKVGQWPAVGQRFLVYLPGSIPWHHSGTVISIEKIQEE